MKVAIVKYNAGNIYSVDCALRRVGVEAEITDNKEILMSADKVIFPGVGEAASTMHYLKKNNLDSLIKDLKQPVLGICIGMHMFPQHIENQYVYFVHSYYVPVCEYTTAETEYILPFSAALHKDNFYASQFHIEKSGAVGEDIFNHILSL